MGDLGFNCGYVRRQRCIGFGDIVAACSTMPFGIDKRLVIVRNADDLKKADSESLVAYLASPADFTVLALLANKLCENTRLYKAAAAVGLRRSSIAHRARHTIAVSEVRAMATSRSIAMTGFDREALVELVGRRHGVHLDAELKKIALAHAGAQPVRPRGVGARHAHFAGEAVGFHHAIHAAKCCRMRTRARAKLGDTSAYALIGFA